MTFEEVETLARKMFSTVIPPGPKDEWFPTLLTVDSIDITALVMLILTSKEDLLGMLEKTFEQLKPKYAALLMPCWMLNIDMKKPLGETTIEICAELGVRTHPDKIEALWLTVADSTKEKTWYAEVQRYDTKPPTLGEWESLEGGESTGRMVGVISNALSLIEEDKK